jgi:hypothetical protein
MRFRIEEERQKHIYVVASSHIGGGNQKFMDWPPGAKLCATQCS